MIELQCINNILAENNIETYLEEGINEDFFLAIQKSGIIY